MAIFPAYGVPSTITGPYVPGPSTAAGSTPSPWSVLERRALSTFLNEAMPRGKGSGEAHHVYVACQSLVTTYELSMQSGVVDEDFFADLQDEIARELRLMEAEEAEAERLSKRIEELYQKLHPSNNLRSIPGVGEHTGRSSSQAWAIHTASAISLLSSIGTESCREQGNHRT